MNYRTDLAIEINETFKSQSTAVLDEEVFSKNGVKITRIKISDEDISKSFGKPVGTYITAQVEPFVSNSELFDGRIEVIAEQIASLLPKEGLILVAGLGNEDITPDALGPRCMDHILATRHIDKQLAESIGLMNIRRVAALVPGVLGKTGVETGEMLKGLVESIRPAAVITVDALAARSLSRLGTTVQISDAGIIPGSGVGNARKGIDKSLLGVDVISIGVPTVVDAQTLIYDITDDGFKNTKSVPDSGETIVTPCQIDTLIQRASMLVAMAINRALHPNLKCEDILSLIT